MFSGGGLLKIIKSERVVEREAVVPDASGTGAKPAVSYVRSFDDGLNQGREEGRAQGLEEGRAAGRSQGFDEGRAAGLEEGERKAREALVGDFAALAKIASELDAARNSMVREAEQEVLKLSIMVAEKVVRTHLEKDDNLLDFVRKLLAVVTDKTRVVVRLCPDEAERLRSAAGTLAADAESGGGLNIVNDDRLVAGDCVIETNSGNFDARVSSQMSEIRRQLENAAARDRQ